MIKWLRNLEWQVWWRHPFQYTNDTTCSFYYEPPNHPNNWEYCTRTLILGPLQMRWYVDRP